MKKILCIIIAGLAILVLLSLIPVKELDSEIISNKSKEYSTIVPAKPPKPPQRLN
jgi:hypothetical protein